jgi:hypothetical protein
MRVLPAAAIRTDVHTGLGKRGIIEESDREPEPEPETEESDRMTETEETDRTPEPPSRGDARR